MQVETYELKDVQQETVEQCAEAKELIEQLGLDGQRQLQSGVETVTRFPYRLMTDEEQFVYSTLCPEQCEAKSYCNEPMPLEVLKTFAYAKSLGAFTYFEVWAASSVRVKDPVLVARKERYGSERYILARWGAELLPLEVLLSDAIRVWHAQYKAKLNKIAQEVAQCLAMPTPEGTPDGSVFKTAFYS